MTPKEGEKVESLSEEERIRNALRISEWEPRPTLLYFHYPHGDPGDDVKEKPSAASKTTKKQCGNLDDEKVARWSNLLHCVELDMSSSHAPLLERFGVKVGDGPSFAIINRDLEVVATSGVCGKKQFIAFIKTGLKKSPDYWKNVQERLDEQKASLKEARALAKKKQTQRALNRYQDVRGSDLRIGSWWDDARKEAERLEKKR